MKIADFDRSQINFSYQSAIASRPIFLRLHFVHGCVLSTVLRKDDDDDELLFDGEGYCDLEM